MKNYLISNILRCFNITRVAIKIYVTEKYGNKRQRASGTVVQFFQFIFLKA